MNILKIGKKSKNLQKPDNDNYHNHNVQDSSDFTIHRDIVIDQPENDAGYNENENNC